MDQRTPQALYQESVTAVFDIISEFTLSRITLPPSDTHGNRFEKLFKFLESKGKFFFLLVVILVIAMIGCGALGYLIKSRLLMNVSAVVYALSVAIWLAYMLAVIFASFPEIIKIFRAPLKPLLQSVRHALDVERPYRDRLELIEINAVKHVLAHYRNEREAMEKRGSLLSGAIDRIGLFPALGGVALLYLGLSALKSTNGWILMLVPVILVFHFMNFLAFGWYQKVDRIIVMLECSVATRS
jgi:hypothetical protein